ncbi:trypsin-like peptidase domain-containing protein [Streptomyces sp. NBC_01005]|uniref:S1C family serine protease n=1 Tax=unclassified Streptomyces TaxID=2593676 RepID=UPI00386E0194|nr:trypsin-like peptidase domain-containing protein [Streptomyces sp. NBC_01005]WTC95033.1 trypsin-like peptidase domain-containing protein [Streptomyces sp. NBC_01650]
MEDGKSTGPKAKWWSRPTPGRTTRTAQDEPTPVADTAAPAADPTDAPTDAVTAPDAVTATEATAGSSMTEPEPPTADAPPAPAPGPVPDASAARLTKPLHEPDEYSTPPYGGPGPWAPAPPVQRPVPTPAHGTPVPPQYAGTNGAGIPTQPAPTPPAPAAPAPAPTGFTPPPPHTPQPQLQQPQQQPQPQPQQPQQPNGASTQWLQYDPWGAPRQPLTNPGPPLGADTGRKKDRRGSLLVGAVLLALVAGGIGGGIGAYIERNGGLTQVELPQAGRSSGGRAPDSVAGIAASALPSVVTLHVSGSTESGTGTGFVLDGSGHILTNNHVVAPAGQAGEITVTFSGGETARGEVVGKDSGYDLAVVKVTGVSGLKPLPLGNSDNVRVGDPVVAIGAPFDLSNTVTSGIISAKDRPITAGGEKGDGSDISYVDALQTDAPINPGNSGGPLVDADAHVIGINSAIRAADSGASEEGGQAGSIGLGFAIPINQGKRVAEELINTGRATHPVIGVTLDMKYTGDGARVGSKGAEGKPAVTPGGPGAKAGIRPGDVITEVDGQRVHSGEELIVKIRAHRPGDRLDLALTRGGKDLSISLTLGSASGT